MFKVNDLVIFKKNTYPNQKKMVGKVLEVIPKDGDTLYYVSFEGMTRRVYEQCLESII